MSGELEKHAKYRWELLEPVHHLNKVVRDVEWIPLEVALAEIQLVIKDLCGLVADLYHQHGEIVKEYEEEIQKLQEDLVNSKKLFGALAESSEQTFKKLEGQVAEANSLRETIVKILNEFPEFIGPEGKLCEYIENEIQIFMLCGRLWEALKK